MFSRSLSTMVILALALAVISAWTGHAYTLSVPGKHPVAEVVQGAEYDHSHGASTCTQCSDHYHSPLTPDHQHETPQLSSTVQLSAQQKPLVRLTAPGHSLPRSPIFLIERPPRPPIAS